MQGSRHSTRGIASKKNGGARLLASCALIAAISLSSPALAAKYALVIGINEYRSVHAITELKYATADAEAVGQQLEALGFQVHLLKNDGAKRHDVVGELNRIARKATKDDTFLLYFAGHGVRRTFGDPTTYWLTYDAQLEVLDDEGIRLTHLMDYVRDIPAQRKIVLLDHCYSGDAVDVAPAPGPVDVSGGAGGGSRGPGGPTLQLEARGQVSADQLRDQIPATAKGTLVIAAARNEAYESGGHGFFTQALLKALGTRDASKGAATLNAAQLVTYLHEQVPVLSNNKQQVSDYASGSDLSTWMLVEKLPDATLTPQQTAQARLDKWSAALIEWSNRGWITYATRVRCYQALLNWSKSLLPAGAPLSPMDEKIRAEVENHMNDTTTQPDALASDLQAVVKMIVGSPP
jgi:hypothetical protein